MKNDLIQFLTTFQEMHNAWKALDSTPRQSANARVAYDNFNAQLKELAMQADRLNYNLPAQFALTLQEVCEQGREFSNPTFGEFRRFTGPLHHLLKEVQEVIDGDGDLSEFADCLLLLLVN